MNSILGRLDHLRAHFLRVTLSNDLIRRVFISRALRLSVFFGLSIFVNFLLALSIPIWMLAVGPLLFGVTHLFSSFRFVPKAIIDGGKKQRSVSRMAGLAVLFIGVIRVLQIHSIYIPNILRLRDGWEWMALIFLFLYIVYFIRPNWKTSLLSGLLFIPLIICSWNFPIMTAAALMIGHNFVAFFYWMKLAKNSNELLAAIGALVVFSLLHAVLLLGFADNLALHLRTAVPDFGTLLDPLTIAKQILPRSTDLALLERAIMMFAFGQAVHYLLWIKIIPEQAVLQNVPLTFRRSKVEIVSDLGLPLFRVAFMSAVGFVGLMMFVEIGLLREIYIAGSAAHGYAEIAGLPFLFLRKS